MLWTLISTTVVLQSVLQATSAVSNKVLLVSMDGFRHDYLTKAETPNFDKMVAEGVTMSYLNNTFVTNTFPCHYSMATGLYSESNGIVGNRMYDPELNSFFTMSTTDSAWWDKGEPVWITARKAGLKAGTYFWPGSEAEIQGLRPTVFFPYNTSVPFEDRVNTVLKWLTVDDFDLAVMYFHEPDTSGHAFGPDDGRMVPVIENMDVVLGWLLQGLDNSTLKGKVNMIVTSDHGMTNIDLQNKIIDLSNYVNNTLLHSLVDQGSIAQIRPQPGMDNQLLEALSGIEHMQVMLKENIPERFHLKNNKRVMPLFAIADEGWTITDNVTKARMRKYKGNHGYDNNLETMKPIYIARGPAFKSGKIVRPIESVDIYPLICYLLDIQTAPNNGSLDRAATLLKYYGNAVPQLSSCSHLLWFLVIVLILTCTLLEEHF
ncbi:unnamed protein product [Candidula unifasciata]|uniref:Ectonucleotide pyrophosphatase/phosphodiesterase family member 5 n=1 Tax=Candidula unifasciata TaxID=100452 RepID=A0A8S4A027_9EUPU|nr:unnamed protein product [Candidula unifasciata]